MTDDMATFRVSVEIENPVPLEGLNFRVEPLSRQLVDAGPAPAAVA